MKNKTIHLVYKATNLETGEAYIGTTTKSIEERKADHIQKANKGTGRCFQEAIVTYGPDSFSWEQIDTANSLNELAEKEKQYIINYNSKEEGYNKDSGGGFKKTVYQYNQDGALIASYNSLKEVGLTLNHDKRRVSNACTTATPWQGSYWSYSQSNSFKIITDGRKKKVFQYNYNGELVAEFISVAEASSSTGLSKSCISRCCRGERQSSGGYIWKY
jgi:group I intron endonuclease